MTIIRPIAIGNTIRRLCGKIIIKKSADSIVSTIGPYQLGCGVKGGCEAAVHATRAYIQANKNTSKVIVKLDFRNAFNCLRRDTLLAVIKDKLYAVFQMTFQMYRQRSMLLWGTETIPSNNGVQQGDPCGPAFFCLAIHDLVASLESEFKPWYLDDGTIGGSLDTVLRDIEKVRAFELRSGLSLNTSKCELSTLTECADFNLEAQLAVRQKLPDIQCQHLSTLELLGAPVCHGGVESALRRSFKQ